MEDMEKTLQNIVLKAKKYDELAFISNTESLHCSFCDKRQQDVKKLVAGPKVFICNECIAICNEICEEECVFDSQQK